MIFRRYAGNGRSVGYTTSTDPSHLELCCTAFDAVWPLGIPHHRYASD